MHACRDYFGYGMGLFAASIPMIICLLVVISYTSLQLGYSHVCPSASEIIPNYMGRNKLQPKHSKIVRTPYTA